MSTNKDKQAAAWDTWTSSLSAAANKALRTDEPNALPIATPVQGDDEETDAYAKFYASLSFEAREGLDSTVGAEPTIEDNIDPGVARYCSVESEDGEWATTRMFKTPEGLARRLGQLEGEDMVAWPFFGIPLRFTKGPQRYLLLPDGENAIQIPVYEGGPCKIVPADLLKEMEVQEDCFLGPPELANTKLVHDKLVPKKATTGDDDDDDEEEAEVEAE